jgi:hypothetical protein
MKPKQKAKRQSSRDCPLTNRYNPFPDGSQTVHSFLQKKDFADV